VHNPHAWGRGFSLIDERAEHPRQNGVPDTFQIDNMYMVAPASDAED
jgi:hypothetical protein